MPDLDYQYHAAVYYAFGRNDAGDHRHDPAGFANAYSQRSYGRPMQEFWRTEPGSLSAPDQPDTPGVKPGSVQYG